MYIGNLSYEVNEEDLKNLFSEYGTVENVKIISDVFSQKSKGFGFVEMPDNSEAEKAMAALDTSELKGRHIKVNEAKPRSDRKSGRRGY
jgi:RNA recognition motif-containing protein